MFKELKVIELANVLAGPAAGMFFAELGAEVIKIENKLTGGDVTRSWKLPLEDAQSESSAYYSSVNWNKRSLMINMNNPEEKQQVLDLIRDADVVISNYKPGDDIKLGMDFTSLKKINPTLIYAHLTGFGEDSHRVAYDLILQAETGFMHLNGTPESGPLKMPVALIDVLSAHQLKEGILVALIKKMKTGEGSHVAVSLYDSAIASLANRASNYLMTGHNPSAEGSLHPNIAPYGETFITADNKKLVLAIGDNRQFHRLCMVAGLEKLPLMEQFSSNTNRVKNRNSLFTILQNAVSSFQSEEFTNQLHLHGVPAALIHSVKEVMEKNTAQDLILIENTSKRVKTAVFRIS
ncbi:MAG: CoA transferase [Bacteroidota bacterium]|nr:CoA transferase [Bacteroidota bacterium]